MQQLATFAATTRFRGSVKKDGQTRSRPWSRIQQQRDAAQRDYKQTHFGIRTMSRMGLLFRASTNEFKMIEDGPKSSIKQKKSEERLRQKQQLDSDQLLKPADIKRMARIPYTTVIKWITTGHPRAGILPSIDLAETGKRHSYRIRPQDWEAFQEKLRSPARKRRQISSPPPCPRSKSEGRFKY